MLTAVLSNNPAETFSSPPSSAVSIKLRTILNRSSHVHLMHKIPLALDKHFANI
jgi:hypothetical protein